MRLSSRPLTLIVSGLLLSGLVACGEEEGGQSGSMPARSGEPVFPGKSWESAGASKVGLSDAGLERALDTMMNDSRCVAIVKDGYLVGSRGGTRLHNPMSVGKSVLSSIIGIMATNGEIDSINDQGIGRNSIRENLEQTIDGSWDYSPTGGQSRDADIAARYGGEPVGRHAKRLLFDPLGMDDTSMANSGFMDSHCEDLARWGHLLASDGVWNGERMISKEYMEESVKPVRGNSAYGFLLWLNHRGDWDSTLGMSGRNSKPIPNAPENMIYAKGFNGQVVIILPDSGIVVARLGTDGLLGDTMGSVRDMYNGLRMAF